MITKIIMDEGLNIENSEVSDEEVINFLLSQNKEPALQVLGAYMQVSNGGDFDFDFVLKKIKEHEIKKTKLRSSSGYGASFNRNPAEMMNGHFGYHAGDYLGSLNDAYDKIPQNYLDTINRFYDQLNDKLTSSYESKVGEPHVAQVMQLVKKIVSSKKIYSRSLNEVEKSKFIHDEYRKRTGSILAKDVEKQDPVYRRLVKQAEFSTVDELKEKEESLGEDEIKDAYVKLAKSFHDRLFKAVDPSFDPSKLTVNLEPSSYSYEKYKLELFIDGKAPLNHWVSGGNALDKLKLLNPSLYLEFEAEQSYLNLIYGYLNIVNEDYIDENVEEMQRAIDAPGEFLVKYEKIRTDDQVSSLMGKAIEVMHILNNHSWQTSEKLSRFRSSFGVNLEAFKIFLNSLNSDSSFSNLGNIGETNSKLASVMEFLRSRKKESLRMTGSSQHLMRFPNDLSICPKDLQNSEFVNYNEYRKDGLTTKVHVNSTDKFVADKYSFEAGNIMYIALPQYAPVTSFTLFHEDAEVIFEENVDYILEYEKKSGHYRVRLISNRVVDYSLAGLSYVAGLDFIENQKDLPKKVPSIKLSEGKVTSLCNRLEESGFVLLANNLRKTLTKTEKRFMFRNPNKDIEFTTDSISKAIRDSIYYSFKTDDIGVHPLANDIEHLLVDEEFDLSFLPKTNLSKSDQSKIRVQCGQVAELYKVIIGYLLVDDSETEVYSTKLYTDISNMTSARLGYRSFGNPHGDTRANTPVADDNEFFKEDLTPGISIDSAKDIIRSSILDLNKLFDKFKKIRNTLNESNSGGSYYFEVIQSEKSFNEFILELKQEAAEYSGEFTGNKKALEQWVNSPPGLFKNPQELESLVKTRPLATVINIILFIQTRGIDFFSDINALKNIKDILSKLDFVEYKKRDNQRFETYVDELTSASVIAHKLKKMIFSLETSQ